VKRVERIRASGGGLGPKMTPDLKAALKVCGTNDPITIVLQLQPRLPRKLKGKQREKVLALWRTAEENKRRVVEVLRRLQERGSRLEIEEGGMFDHVIVRAPKQVILGLPDLPDVKGVLPNRQFDALT
jgi:hypothetical protein